MLIVKIMSGENAPDDDSRKSFALHANVLSVEFSRNEGGAQVRLLFSGTVPLSETIACHGNVYVMNEAGKTVASFGSAGLDPADFKPSDKHPPHVHRPVARDHSGELAKA